MAFPKRINDNLWIIPSHVKMSAHGNTNDRVLLRSIREVVQETPFDYVLIDSPGYKNNIFRACINASGIIVIPSKVSLQDADQTAECLDEIQNQEFDGTYGIVINDIDKKTVREDEIQALYANVLESVLQTRVPHMRGLFRMATEPGYEISGAGKKIIKSLIEEVLS
jgi:cellulose biosynthesis protein BcsQ